MEIFMGIILFVLGLCLGSFVNMLVFRTAEGYGLTSSRGRKPWRSAKDGFATLAMTNKRSFCDFCGRQLKWYENIPVFSWVIQRGKTRCCGNPLPGEYPVVEIGMGLLFVIVGTHDHAFLPIGVHFIIITLLVFSFIFDLKYMILPDFSTFILIGLALILLIGTNDHAFLQNIMVAIIAGGFLLMLNLITKGKGMGMGDVKLAVFIGLLLSFPLTIVALYMAFIGGAIVGVILILSKKLKRKSLIPFGPFLIMGTVMAWWWGEGIIKIINSRF